MSKWWNSLTETERFERSIELGVPDLPYNFFTKVEKKKVSEAVAKEYDYDDAIIVSKWGKLSGYDQNDLLGDSVDNVGWRAFSTLSPEEKETVRMVLGEANSYTNYGSQTGGNLTPAANGKSVVDSAYGDKDVEELSEVSLDFMEKARQWHDLRHISDNSITPKSWKDMNIKGRQNAINAYIRNKSTGEVEPTHIGQKNHNIDTYLDKAEFNYDNDIKEDNDAFLELQKNADEFNINEGRLDPPDSEIDDPDPYDNDYTQENNEEVGETEEDIERELLTEIAKEGGIGSGKSGHQKWMRGASEGPDYDTCKNCGISTEIRQGKCSMCGKAGESYGIEVLEELANERKDWDEQEIKKDKLPMGYQERDEDTGFYKEDDAYNQMIQQQDTLDKTELNQYDSTSYDWQKGQEVEEKCHICDSETHDTDSHYDNLPEEADEEYNPYDHIGDATMEESSEVFEEPYNINKSENSYDNRKEDEEKPKDEGEEVVGGKVKGVAVENVANTTQFCDCGFYTNDQGELDRHEC